MGRMKHNVLIMMLLVGGTLWAQNDEVNLSVTTQVVSTLKQGRIENVSMMDGRLYFCLDGMMYSSSIDRQTAVGCDVDADLMNKEEGITYVVRHPATGRLYFTKVTHWWRSTLYEYNTEGRRAKAVEVKLKGFDFDVNHPTFTPDGKTMVFDSRDPSGSGGVDLWYSQWDGNEWSHPKPLGATVNSTANDRTPFINGDYLYFSSNRGNADSANYDLYACRLVSAQQVQGDTVFTYPIGKGKVQRMTAPFSSSQDESNLVYDAKHNCGFWVVRNINDTTQPDKLYSFAGDIIGVRLSGNIQGTYSHERLDETFPYNSKEQNVVLDKVGIAVFDAATPSNIPLYITQSDAQGHYYLYLKPQHSYKIIFHKDGFLNRSIAVDAKHGNDDLLYVQMSKDVQLQGYYLNADYIFNNEKENDCLFDQAVSTTLSDNGRRQLRGIAQYLADNPQLHLYVTVIFTQKKENFNRLVAYSREDAIQQYLWQHGVDIKLLNNAKYETVVASEDDRDSVNNAVLFFFSDEELEGAKDDAAWDDNVNSLRHFLEAGDDKTSAQDAENTKKKTHTSREVPLLNQSNVAPAMETPEEEEEEPTEINPEFRKAMEQGK